MSDKAERFTQLRGLARQARARGLDRRERRERVIASVAWENLGDEPEEVVEVAVGKYFEVGLIPKGGNPVVMDAIHSEKPGAEPPTGEMVKRIATMANCGWMRAKWSRDTKADANRRSFRRQERSTANEKTTTREAPTSIRAALYWGMERMIDRLPGWRRGKGDLEKPFLRVALHGMTGKTYVEKSQAGEKLREEQVDFVVGGGSQVPGKRQVSAAVLEWYALNLAKKLGERRLGVATEILGVGVELASIDQVRVYRGNQNGEVVQSQITKLDEKGKKSNLSGGGLGLEDYRFGKTYEERMANGRFRKLRFNGMGKGFLTLQLEISKRVRADEAMLAQVEVVLAELSETFGSRFNNLSSLDTFRNERFG